MQVFDMEQNELTSEAPNGTFGQISYRRLVGVLRDSGNLQDDEVVTHFHFTKDFLRFRVEKVKR